MMFRIKISLLIFIFICAVSRPLYSGEFSVSGHTATVDLTGYGYMLSCSKPALYVYENGKWRPARLDLPGKGNYYIDDRFVGYGWCDYLVCNPIGQPVQIDLIEYERAGERPAPENYFPGKKTKFPVFKSMYLKGKIRIEIRYFKDQSCKEAVVYSNEFLIE